MLLSEMAQKELIQVEDGVRYGFLADTDLIFNRKTGDIIGFEVKKKFSRMPFRNKEQESVEFIPWSEIVLVGEHRILFGKTHSMGDFDVEDDY
ncbi:YlmC/YmxH family sporulation protein [Sporosarcina sp. Sa2YVA2]|uniref:YlmC/YmxH family sporulation protein n=1 Tax=Sporosarcina quadrami TaxID=2762234 RepID=A0ABR8U7W7_9BACL|nr:YlmC/YmxH family sporulation protein [Sporosarcina quadrami]MBD7983579.1 YlmC/YmxH family sporulation protein [Sporosarcina quadrami]